jgi:hypothetical protein
LNLPIASRSYDEGDRDICLRRELKRGGTQIDTGASRHRSEFFGLFDRHGGNPEIVLAMVVARAARYEAGIERGSDDKRTVLFAHGRKTSFTALESAINEYCRAHKQTSGSA